MKRLDRATIAMLEAIIRAGPPRELGGQVAHLCGRCPGFMDAVRGAVDGAAIVPNVLWTPEEHLAATAIQVGIGIGFLLAEKIPPEADA